MKTFLLSYLKKISLFFAILIIMGSFTVVLCQKPRGLQVTDLAPFVSVETTKNPSPKITLKWKKNDIAIKYSVTRRDIDAESWGLETIVDTSKNMYEDTKIIVGKPYEYRVIVYLYASVRWQLTVGQKQVDTTSSQQVLGFSYICSGIDIEEVSSFGKVMILVDSVVAPALENELSILENDLVTEGWHVVKKTAPRAENFNSKAVLKTKSIITEEYYNPGELAHVFIIGRVAVPYSGFIAPDGHSNHFGAWPADVFYGNLDEFSWTDNNYYVDSMNILVPNRNSAGDGKFDQNNLQGMTASIAVGRVDFYNISLYTKDSLAREIQHLKNYLIKDHNYRTGATQVRNKALLLDTWGLLGNEVPGATSWRNFNSLCGYDSIKTSTMDKFYPDISANDYQWVYASGGGSNQSVGSLNSSSFSTYPIRGVFSMVFGSYFGDWDPKNNLMRTILGSSPSVLTVSWDARPPWFFHHMGIGYPIGFSTLVTQNNGSSGLNYYSNTYLNTPYYGNIYNTSGFAGVHIGLLGDPTLRINMASIPSPSNLTVVQPNGSRFVEIKWQSASAEENTSYNVYRSMSTLGPFIKVNKDPIFTTSYNDSTLNEGNVYYMVRTVQPQKSVTGVYKNLSRGIIKSGLITSVDNPADIVSSLSCSPNPAVSQLNISLNLSNSEFVSLSIFDIRGNLIKTLESRWLASGGSNLSWNLCNDAGSRVAPGVYYVRAIAGNFAQNTKIVVLP
ncbi:MAG: hypothetical protein HW421_2890 [Ignavibacteria bacterium]|nr:hypothetical protein [Ignavibacteria bacterium]